MGKLVVEKAKQVINVNHKAVEIEAQFASNGDQVGFALIAKYKNEVVAVFTGNSESGHIIRNGNARHYNDHMLTDMDALIAFSTGAFSVMDELDEF